VVRNRGFASVGIAASLDSGKEAFAGFRSFLFSRLSKFVSQQLRLMDDRGGLFSAQFRKS